VKCGAGGEKPCNGCGQASIKERTTLIATVAGGGDSSCAIPIMKKLEDDRISGRRGTVQSECFCFLQSRGLEKGCRWGGISLVLDWNSRFNFEKCKGSKGEVEVKVRCSDVKGRFL